MIVDPNKLKLPETDIPSVLETDTPSTPTPDRKKSHWKKVLVLVIVLAIHLAFTLLDAFVFRGPFARDWIRSTEDTGHIEIDRLEYHVVPERNEIVMTWTEPVILNRSRWGEAEKHSRTIPLDPLPPEFARCYVDVTVDPDAPAMIQMPYGGDEYLAPIPYFDEGNVIGTDPEIPPGPRRQELPPDMVVHLRVRPKDVPALSKQFHLTIRKQKFFVTAGTLMVPYPNAGNGRREMLMTTTRDDERPYRLELWEEAKSRPHKMPSKVGPMLARIVLLPIVVIPDYFADIAILIWALSVDWN